MRISVHLRSEPSATNVRCRGLAYGLAEAGHTVVYSPRREYTKGVDLVIQAGFNATTALRGAIDDGIPYLIMEAPPFRTLCPWEEWSSFGYNGLAGGATRPDPLDAPRPTPGRLPPKIQGSTLIIGQKPTDHSLRGSDHIRWLEEKQVQYPDARIRHHPIMLPSDETIEEALLDVKRVITYTSTVSVDARFAGCEVIIDGSGSWGLLSDRALSYAAYHHDDYFHKHVGLYVLSGYDEAADRAKNGLVEIPRKKVDGRAICQQYYQRLL